MAPVRKLQIQTKYAAWMSDGSKEKIKERNRAQDVAILSGSQEDWATYKQLRNNLNKVMHKEKLSWQRGKL